MSESWPWFPPNYRGKSKNRVYVRLTYNCTNEKLMQPNRRECNCYFENILDLNGKVNQLFIGSLVEYDFIDWLSDTVSSSELFPFQYSDWDFGRTTLDLNDIEKDTDMNFRSLYIFLDVTNTIQSNRIVNSLSFMFDVICETSRELSPLVNEDVFHPSLRIRFCSDAISSKFNLTLRHRCTTSRKVSSTICILHFTVKFYF